MPEAPVVRPLREEDLQRLPAFLAALFPGWPTVADVATEEHLGWKLAGGPNALDSHTIAVAGTEVAALACFWAADVRIGGRTLRAAIGFDMGVAEAFRGHGLFSRILSAGPAFDLQFSQTGNDRAAAAWERFGGRSFAVPVDVLARPLRGGWMRRPAAGRTGTDSGTGIRVTTAARFDERVRGLWTAAREGVDFAIERTPQWLNWRHADPRGGRASIRLAEDRDGTLLGYAVTRLPRGEAFLADLVVAPGREEVARALLADAAAIAREAGARRLRSWLSRTHPCGPAFAAEGFRPTGRGVRMMYHRISAPEGSLEVLESPAARLHVMAGDMDVV